MVSDIAGLAHVYSNVWADLCWLPLISPTAAHRLMHELIDVCNTDRVVWGCDTWTSEESYGARLAFLEVLSQVLYERVELEGCANPMPKDTRRPLCTTMLPGYWEYS